MKKWKLFETGQKGGKSEITFSKSKYIRFSPTLMSENELGNFKYVLIYLNDEEDEIYVGFNFLKEKDKDGKALKLGKPENGGGAYCSGNSLFTKLKIDTKKIEKSLHFTPTKERFEEKILFVIKVSK